MRAFPKGKLVINPYTTEVKDRYWTFNKAARCKTDSQKPLVLDGRLFSKPSSPSEASTDRYSAIFWLVGKAEDKKSSNMETEHVKVECSMSMKMPNKTELTMPDVDIAVPVMMNPKAIAPNTLLLVAEDTELTAMANKSMAAAEKEKAAAAPAAKKKVLFQDML